MHIVQIDVTKVQMSLFTNDTHFVVFMEANIEKPSNGIEPSRRLGAPYP